MASFPLFLPSCEVVKAPQSVKYDREVLHQTAQELLGLDKMCEVVPWELSEVSAKIDKVTKSAHDLLASKRMWITFSQGL